MRDNLLRKSALLLKPLLGEHPTTRDHISKAITSLPLKIPGSQTLEEITDQGLKEDTNLMKGGLNRTRDTILHLRREQSLQGGPLETDLDMSTEEEKKALTLTNPESTDATNRQRAVGGINCHNPLGPYGVPSRSMDMPEEAISQARDEIRGYMVQYTNCQDPTESAARKERLRQAEEQGEIEEAADRLARSNMVPNGLQITEPFPEVSPARTPIAQRLGSISESQSAFDRLGPRGSPQDQDPLPQSAQQHQKRRVGKPHLRRTTPLSLTMINAGLRKRKTYALWTVEC
ncbi:hypothetical protein YC2023_103052 [Brassica napus]